MDTKKRDHIIEELFKIDGVREVAEVTGRFDILVTMYAKSSPPCRSIGKP